MRQRFIDSQINDATKKRDGKELKRLRLAYHAGQYRCLSWKDVADSGEIDQIDPRQRFGVRHAGHHSLSSLEAPAPESISQKSYGSQSSSCRWVAMSSVFDVRFDTICEVLRKCKGSVCSYRMSRLATLDDIVADPRKIRQQFIDDRINNVKKKRDGKELKRLRMAYHEKEIGYSSRLR
ncbi:hypothetical protein BZA77DRAFT_343098 [Pyronema omphalodes]|nr:hypothetical protein BZA77DRAFT_343098 [Pyronema omphalodes]